MSNKIRTVKFTHCSVSISILWSSNSWFVHVWTLTSSLSKCYHLDTKYLSLQMIRYSCKTDIQEYIIQLRKTKWFQFTKWEVQSKSWYMLLKDKLWHIKKKKLRLYLGVYLWIRAAPSGKWLEVLHRWGSGERHI